MKRRKSVERYRIQRIRAVVQVAITLFSVYIGWRFYLFVKYLETRGVTPFVPRPPSVEAYLPISALLSFKYFITTGVFDLVHPAGLSLFIIILFTSWLFKRGFCSWICPIGTLSEWDWKLGKKFFGENIKLPQYLDYPLRSLKYLLLLFFVTAALRMNTYALKLFQEGSYNQVADIKMLKFFTNISQTALAAIVLLVLFSLLFKNFWCRYLCPYGALLGMLAWFSPLKPTRDREKCTDCNKCTEVCPSLIDVAKKGRIHSSECTGCLACISACPVKGALELKMLFRQKAVTDWVFAASLVGLFFLLIGIAQFTGHWQTSISLREYQTIIFKINLYTHPGG